MTKTTIKPGDTLPCGMISLKMFQIPHSKALIIAYLDLRSGPKMKGYNFNVADISNQTNIGKTVVRQCLKELVAEGVLHRMGKSFYKLDRQKMEASYYRHVSESDTHVSKTDTDVSESDTLVSESVTLHSSKLDSRELNSRGQIPAVATNLSKEWERLLGDVQAPAPEPLKIFPLATAGEASPITDPTKVSDSVGQSTAMLSGSSHRPVLKKRSDAEWRKIAAEQYRNLKLTGSPFGR